MKCMAVPMAVSLLLFLNLTSAQVNTSESLPMNPQETIATNTANSKNHTTLLAAIEAAELNDVLSMDGPFTVFAPSDLAFRKLSDSKIDELLNGNNKKNVQNLITYHMVAGNLSASNILKAMCRGKGKASFTTVQGEELTASMQGIDIILTDSNGNTAKITTADSEQCNGVIHEIDSVFLPAKF